MSELMQPLGQIMKINDNMRNFESTVVRKVGVFCVEIMRVVKPSMDQMAARGEVYGIVQLGLRYYSSINKIDPLKNSMEKLTGGINSISRSLGATPSFGEWQRCHEESPYSFFNTFFWK